MELNAKTPRVMSPGDTCGSMRESAKTVLARRIDNLKEELKILQALEADINWDKISPPTDNILWSAVFNRRI